MTAREALIAADRDRAWRLAAQRRNEARRYYIAWQVARMRAAEKRDLAESCMGVLEEVSALADEWEADPPIWRDPAVGPATELRAALRGDR